MSKRTRVGIIGAGYISDWHADAIQATDQAELTAVVDNNLAAAQEFAAQRGITAFGSVQELLSAGVVDAVHVLTPPEYHRAVSEECIAGGFMFWWKSLSPCPPQMLKRWFQRQRAQVCSLRRGITSLRFRLINVSRH
ncbi:Gfo/Idh/MocA family protein [Sulfitobacter pacificus]|uniref:Gfo/Idh/MocA family protein n=1 Tax=Sulfitobacter pacificus TaxID=1499314 RepID=UPI00361BA158